MDLGLTGRVALVTGGSKGIGLAVARQLAEEGAEPVLVARTGTELAAAAESIAARTGRMPRFATADVGDDASVAGLAEQIGPVQVLVNAGATPNAGGFPESELSDHINVKVQGALRTARAFAPGMVAAGWGAAPLPDQGGAAGRGDRAVGREGRGHRVPGARPAARAGARPPR